MADDEYIVDPIEPDETSLEDIAIDYLETRWSGWRAADGNLEVWMISAMVRLTAEAQTLATDVPAAIFRWFGQTMLGINPIAPEYAEVHSTWTLVDNPAGRTIESGTGVSLTADDGGTATFEVVEDVFLDIDELTTLPGEVLLRSQESGALFNSLGGAGVVVDKLDSIVWVDTIALTEATSKGKDEEAEDSYLDRLSRRLTLLTPRPILAPDFAVLARDLAAQEGADVRAIALDNFNPDTGLFDQERYVTVAMSDAASGGDVTGPINAAVDSQLQALREVNFVVRTINATRTPVDVTFNIVVIDRPEYDPDAVLSETITSVSDILQSYAWGRIPGGSSSSWIVSNVLRRQDVSTAINSVDGVAYWTVLTIGLNGAAQTAAETYNLPGAVPLTSVGDIVGTRS